MKKTLSIIYPFFFALYPILELRNYNITYVDSASLVRPIILSILFTGLIWALLRVIVKDWRKTGIIATLIIISFFSYGHVYLQIDSVFVILVRHRYLGLIFAGILLFASRGVNGRQRDDCHEAGQSR